MFGFYYFWGTQHKLKYDYSMKQFPKSSTHYFESWVVCIAYCPFSTDLLSVYFGQSLMDSFISRYVVTFFYLMADFFGVKCGAKTSLHKKITPIKRINKTLVLIILECKNITNNSKVMIICTYTYETENTYKVHHDKVVMWSRAL